MPGARVHVVEMFGALSPQVDLGRFDVIVIHYSLVVAHDQYVSPALRERINASPALKAVFIQDEYRHIDRTIAAFKTIGVDVLFTCVPEPAIGQVYSESRLPNVRKKNVLTGYVDKRLLTRKTKPFEARSVDVGYRARKVPAWLGDLGQEKWEIGQRFLRESRAFGLICDISYREEERLYGDAWIHFVGNCKAFLGVESGSSVFDFGGVIQGKVDQAVALDPLLTYATLKERYFSDADGLINQRQISPRCFEAAALRTLMILYEGSYSNLMEPWRHYVPLAKDHSNMAEVVAALRTPEKVKPIIDRAYYEVACNPENQFSHHAEVVAGVLREEHAKRIVTRAVPYDRQELGRLLIPDSAAIRRRTLRNAISYTHYILFRWVLGFLPERQRDRVSRLLGICFNRAVGQARRLFNINT